MSNSVLTFLTRCFQVKSYQPVCASTKKDDELSPEAIRSWISTHPATEDIAKWKALEIKTYVHQLFQDLPAAEICEANPCELKTHLVEVANRCERAQRAVLDEWQKVKLSDQIKKDIEMSLILTMPKLS